MRRTIATLLCVLALVTVGVGSATAQDNAGAEMVRGASATWFRHNGDHGTLYFLDVYHLVGTYGGQPEKTRAWFGAIPCEVGGRRNGPVDCRWRRADYHRVRVDSFEIDPALNSAHAVVHYGDRRGEVSWTGRGDYSEPFLWQSFGELVAPPYFAHVYANVMAAIGRGAGAQGDVFGLDLKRNEFMGGGMANIVYANGGACLTGPWCW